MVEKWKKDFDKVSKSLRNINIERILEDILSRNYDKYDISSLSGVKNQYRIRIGKYRIIFKDVVGEEVQLIAIKSRGQVYKGLK